MRHTPNPFVFRSPIAIACVLSFAIAFIAGCDSRPPCYPVSGTVIFSEDDSPAQFGTIEFRSQTEPPAIARGIIRKDGAFTAKSTDGRAGLIAGKYQMIIIQVIGNPRNGSVVHHHGLEVNKKYNSYKTSDLEIEVTPDGENKFDLVVDSK